MELKAAFIRSVGIAVAAMAGILVIICFWRFYQPSMGQIVIDGWNRTQTASSIESLANAGVAIRNLDVGMPSSPSVDLKRLAIGEYAVIVPSEWVDSQYKGIGVVLSNGRRRVLIRTFEPIDIPEGVARTLWTNIRASEPLIGPKIAEESVIDCVKNANRGVYIDIWDEMLKVDAKSLATESNMCELLHKLIILDRFRAEIGGSLLRMKTGGHTIDLGDARVSSEGNHIRTGWLFDARGELGLSLLYSAPANDDSDAIAAFFRDGIRQVEWAKEAGPIKKSGPDASPVNPNK